MLVPTFGRAEAVQPLRQLLVDVDHQRVLLRRIEVLRLGQDRAQLLAVGVDVLDELGLAPDELRDCCGLAFDTFFMSLKLVSLTQRSGNSSKRDSVKTTVSAFFALVRRAERLVEHHDLLGRRGGRQAGDAVEAGRARPVVGRPRAAAACSSGRRALRDRASDSGTRCSLLAPLAAGHMRAPVPSGFTSQMSNLS